MGNYAFLDLCGSGWQGLPEGERAIVSLECKNDLPLFWLALFQEENLSGHWESEVRAMFANPDELLADSDEFTLEPLRLSWRDASANLASACELAEVRLPELFPLLRAWADALVALAGQGPTEEVQLRVQDTANFYEDADRFLDELHRLVRLWHGADRPDMPVITDAETQLTGFGWLMGAPFPATPPAWCPDRSLPGLPSKDSKMEMFRRALRSAAEWAAVLLAAVTILGAAALGSMLLGVAGAVIGSVLGLAVSVVVVWKWAGWGTSR